MIFSGLELQGFGLVQFEPYLTGVQSDLGLTSLGIGLVQVWKLPYWLRCGLDSAKLVKPKLYCCQDVVENES